VKRLNNTEKRSFFYAEENVRGKLKCEEREHKHMKISFGTYMHACIHTCSCVFAKIEGNLKLACLPPTRGKKKQKLLVNFVVRCAALLELN
jgi:hypothetical protein